VQIDDQALAGMNNEEVATRLRGRAGTSVTLKLRRSVCYKQFHLYITEDDNQGYMSLGLRTCLAGDES